MTPENQSWEAWANHVLRTLEKLETKVDSLEKRMAQNNLESKVDITAIKAKAGVWGIIAGFIASIITTIIAGLFVWNLTHGVMNKSPVVPNPQGASIEYVLPPKEDEYAKHMRELIGEDIDA